VLTKHNDAMIRAFFIRFAPGYRHYYLKRL